MRRPSFPTVISLIALFVALGGTSYAVVKLPAKSVGGRELKNNAVTSAKVRPRSIARSDLAPTARLGLRGPRGTTGPAGPAGASGASVETWKPLQVVTPWSHYGDDWPLPSYRKDAAGRVFLRGLVKRAGGLGPGGAIAVLPPGYTPVARTMSGATTYAAGVFGVSRLDIEISGELRWSGGPGGDPNFVSLDGVSLWTG